MIGNSLQKKIKKNMISLKGDIKKLKLKKRICPVCKNKSYSNFSINKSYSKIDTNGIIYDYAHILVICKYCNLVYTNPWLGYLNTNKIYENSAIGSAFEKSNKAEKHFRCFRSFFPKKKMLSRDTTILEIGSATGVLLKNISVFYKLKKKNLLGVEPSKKLAQQIKGNKYFNIKNKFIDEFKTKKKYDLIILDNVLEHIEEPRKALKKIKALMHSNSIIYVAVPNILKFKKNFRDPFGHTINYYENNIKYLFSHLGFKIVKMKKHYNYINFIAMQEFKDTQLKVNFKQDLEKKFKTVKAFVHKSKQHKKELLKYYKEIEKNIKKNKFKIILYGASNFALEFLKNTNLNKNILFLIDSNPIYYYQKRFGYNVLPPENLYNAKFDRILITSRAFSSDIKNYIEKLGIAKKKIIQL